MKKLILMTVLGAFALAAQAGDNACPASAGSCCAKATVTEAKADGAACPMGKQASAECPATARKETAKAAPKDAKKAAAKPQTPAKPQAPLAQASK